jgi:hypothetical protein
MDLSYSDESREGREILIRGRLKQLPGGHYEDLFMPAPPDTTGGKSDVQAVGSTNSFLRRYVACTIFNIVVVGAPHPGKTRHCAGDLLPLVRSAQPWWAGGPE